MCYETHVHVGAQQMKFSLRCFALAVREGQVWRRCAAPQNPKNPKPQNPKIITICIINFKILKMKMDVIKVNSSVLNFEKEDESKAPKANFEITNLSDSSNIAFKIKTTSPKLFVVKPI